MKKAINLGAVCLAALMLALGIVAIFTAVAAINPKRSVGAKEGYYNCYLAKDGRTIVFREVGEYEEDEYVQSTGYEIVSAYECYKREEKSDKIYLNKMKAAYEENKTEKNEQNYLDAKVVYEMSINDRKQFGRKIFLSATSAFFNPYFVIIVLCGVALIINNGINRKEEK